MIRTDPAATRGHHDHRVIAAQCPPTPRAPLHPSPAPCPTSRSFADAAHAPFVPTPQSPTTHTPPRSSFAVIAADTPSKTAPSNSNTNTLPQTKPPPQGSGRHYKGSYANTPHQCRQKQRKTNSSLTLPTKSHCKKNRAKHETAEVGLASKLTSEQIEVIAKAVQSNSDIIETLGVSPLQRELQEHAEWARQELCKIPWRDPNTGRLNVGPLPPYGRFL